MWPMLHRIRPAGIVTMLFMVPILMLAACSTKPTVPEVPAKVWMKKGTGAFLGVDPSHIYGVGQVSDVSLNALASDVADARARKALAAMVQTTVQVSLSDMMMADSPRGTHEQAVKQVVLTSTLQTLPGSMIVDHYFDNDTQSLYALARLPLARFDEMVRDVAMANKLNPGMAADQAKAMMQTLPVLPGEPGTSGRNP